MEYSILDYLDSKGFSEKMVFILKSDNKKQPASEALGEWRSRQR